MFKPAWEDAAFKNGGGRWVIKLQKGEGGGPWEQGTFFLFIWGFSRLKIRILLLLLFLLSCFYKLVLRLVLLPRLGLGCRPFGHLAVLLLLQTTTTRDGQQTRNYHRNIKDKRRNNNKQGWNPTTTITPPPPPVANAFLSRRKSSMSFWLSVNLALIGEAGTRISEHIPSVFLGEFQAIHQTIWWVFFSVTSNAEKMGEVSEVCFAISPTRKRHFRLPGGLSLGGSTD